MSTQNDKNALSEHTVIAQPQSVPDIQGSPTSGPVIIRHLRDDPEDAVFVGRILVETFRSKYVHATSEGSVPDVIRAIAMTQRGQEPQYYQRNFVAEYEHQPVGIVSLLFQGDPLQGEDSDAFNVFGCCDICGLRCMNFASDLQTTDDLGLTECYIKQVAVTEEFREKGVGKALLDQADSEARRHGCTTLSLMVPSNTWAAQLYDRHGYRVTSRRWKCGWFWCTTGVCCFAQMEKHLD